MSVVLDVPAAPSVPAVVADLADAVEAAVDLVCAGAMTALSEAELLAITVELQSVASRAQALVVAATAEVHASRAVTRDGFVSTTSWLEAKGRLSKGQSRAVVGMGERLSDEFTATREAWLSGAVSEGAVREITTLIPRRLKGLASTAYAAHRAELETMALHLARTRTVPEVRRALERAVIAADPDRAEAAVVAARESEFLSFTPVPDGVEVRGFLSLETAGLVLTAFDQCHDAKYRNGDLAEDYADDVDRLTARTPGLRRRRREHRNAEILAELATHLLDDGALGSKHAQRPHLTVTVHADDYADGLGGDLLLPGFGKVPVPNATIDRLLCDAEIHPVLIRRPGAPPGSSDEPAREYPGSVPGSTGPPWRPRLRPRGGDRGGWDYDVPGERLPTPDELAADTDVAALAALDTDLDDHVSWWNRFLGEPARHVLDVGRSYRSATPKIRHALDVRDAGCAVPGCDADQSRCQAHHITYWSHGGATSLANLVLLCSKHHHMVHEGRWRIHRDPDREPGDPRYIVLVPASPRPSGPPQPQQDRPWGSP